MGWVAAVGARGQTITQPEPPPGSEFFYGPLLGPQWVKNNAGPDPVLDPGGGITFTTMADLQTKINANAAGSRFVHAAGGTETPTSTVDCGTKNPKIWFLGLAGSTSTVIDGQYAERHGIISTGGGGYELHGGQFKRFGNPVTADVSIWRAVRINGPGVIEDVVATDSGIGIGVAAGANNVTVRRNRAHGNHRYGISGTQMDNLTVEHNIIENNNTAQLSFDDASGTKFSGTPHNLIVRYNWAKNNHGWGLWGDGYMESCTVTENVTEDNWRGGLFWELAHGGNVISRNACYRDCAANTEVETRHTRAAILLSESDGTLGPGGGNNFTRNISDTAAWPIILWDTDNRADTTRAADVTENDFWLRSSGSRVGGDDAKLTQTMHTGATFTWVTNVYHVLSLSNNHWYWPNGTLDSEQLSFAAWDAKGFTSGETRLVI